MILFRVYKSINMDFCGRVATFLHRSNPDRKLCVERSYQYRVVGRFYFAKFHEVKDFAEHTGIRLLHTLADPAKPQAWYLLRAMDSVCPAMLEYALIIGPDLLPRLKLGKCDASPINRDTTLSEAHPHE